MKQTRVRQANPMKQPQAAGLRLVKRQQAASQKMRHQHHRSGDLHNGHIVLCLQRQAAHVCICCTDRHVSKGECGTGQVNVLRQKVCKNFMHMYKC